LDRKEPRYHLLSEPGKNDAGGVRGVSCRPRKEFKNLPYVGFTFTSDKGKVQALECKVRQCVT